VRLIPFVYSADIAYQCEFGSGYIRFYYDGEPLMDGLTVVNVETPYAASDLAAMQYKQIGDVMWLVHGSYAPRKLSRVSAASFTLTLEEFPQGLPFLDRNDLDAHDNKTLTCSVTAKGVAGTLTASAALFDELMVGGEFLLLHARATTNVSYTRATTTTGESTAIDVKGDFAFNTHGHWHGTVILQRNQDGAGWESYRTYLSDGDRNIQLAATETEDNVQYRINVSEHASGGTVRADISVNDSTQESRVKIDTVTSSTVAQITTLTAVASTDATPRWAECAWSDYRGWPCAIGFCESRMVYGGTDHQRQALWFSETDDYSNFEAGINDADSFSLTLITTNDIRWIEALDGLLVGTSGEPWAVASNKIGTPITPTNFSAKQQSTCGAKPLQAVRVRNAVLFVDSVGRKVHEVAYRPDEERYVAPDMTALAEHITKDGIVATALQQSPDTILWCVRADGVLLSLTYEREQNIIAWARHPMDDAVVESVSVIPGDTEDQVWLVVKRSLHGGDTRFIERMRTRDFGTQSDAYFVDAGVYYNAGPTTTFAGLDHLEGDTVAILGDGAVFTNQVVSGGQVILASAVSKASIGLPRRYTLQPMRIESNASTHGSQRKIAELVLSFLESGGVQYGKSLSALYDIDFRTTEVYGAPPALYTGDKRVVFDGGFDPEDPILITGTQPLPCTLRAIVARWHITGN